MKYFGWRRGRRFGRCRTVVEVWCQRGEEQKRNSAAILSCVGWHRSSRAVTVMWLWHTITLPVAMTSSSSAFFALPIAVRVVYRTGKPTFLPLILTHVRKRNVSPPTERTQQWRQPVPICAPICAFFKYSRWRTYLACILQVLHLRLLF